MDTTKWRTVAISIGDYKILKGLCNKTHRAPAKMIAKLIESHLIYISKKEQVKLDKLKSNLSENIE